MGGDTTGRERKGEKGGAWKIEDVRAGVGVYVCEGQGTLEEGG